MRLPRCLGVLACLLALVTTLGPVSAQPAQDLVEKGISEFQDLEFVAAIGTLEELLKRPDLSESQKLVALELIAISHLSLGNTAESRRAFVRLLKIRPDYVLRNHDGSPKVESLFESVRAGMPKIVDPKDPPVKDPPPKVESGPTQLAPGRITGANAGRRVEMIVVSRGTEPKELLLYWRLNSESAFQELPLRQKNSTWRAKLSLPKSPDNYALQYYVQAKGVAGQDVAQLGSREEPLALPVRGGDGDGSGGRASGPWYRRWPVWAGVGAVVVGGTILVLSSGSDPQQGALSPGRITLSP